jgi:cytochrome c553
MTEKGKISATCWLAGALLAMAGSAGAAGADARSIVQQGNGHGAPACQACHGSDGKGLAAAGYPRLAGLHPDYLHKQLDNFASGTRQNAVMRPIAEALSPVERDAISLYYGGLPAAAPVTADASASTAAEDVGTVLATRGRWSQQVPACEQCHGPGGVGVGANFPALAGQPAAYLQAQLQAWKAGTRHNDPLELMQHLSAALSDADIAAVSRWFAAPSARPREQAP